MTLIERYRWLIIFSLIAAILMGGAVFFYRQYTVNQTLEITITPPSSEIRIYITGEVVTAGSYALEEGDRIEDAVEVAGGLTPDADLSAIDLAARLEDGDIIRIYKMGDVPQKVNINTADAWLLEALAGIGPVLAQRIIDYRTENGPFQRIEDLGAVEGIGEGTYDKLRDKITVR